MGRLASIHTEFPAALLHEFHKASGHFRAVWGKDLKRRPFPAPGDLLKPHPAQSLAIISLEWLQIYRWVQIYRGAHRDGEAV
jgi:hypothetical protein